MAQSKLWNAIWLQGTGAPRARRCSHEPGRETGIQADSYRTRVRREAAHTDSAAVLHMRRRCLPLAPHSNTPPRYRTAGIFSISSYCTFSKRFVFWTSEHAGGPLRPKAYVIKPAVDKLKKNMLLFPARTAARAAGMKTAPRVQFSSQGKPSTCVAVACRSGMNIHTHF